jgi:hypothetical protein
MDWISTMSSARHQHEDVFLPGGPLQLNLFSSTSRKVLKAALEMANTTSWDNLRSPHIFMGLLAVPDSSVREWGKKLQADLPGLLAQFQELFQQPGKDKHFLTLHREFLSDSVLRLLRESWCRCKLAGRRRIRPMDLLICLFTSTNSVVAECFERIGLTAAKLTELAVLAENHEGATGSEEAA